MKKIIIFSRLMFIAIFIATPAHAMQDAADDLGEQLFLAAGDIDLKEIQRLIEAGAPIDYVQEDYDMTPMQAVIEYAHIEPNNALLCLNAFITAGAQINLANRVGTTALEHATFLYNQPICELLINAMLWIPTPEQRTRMITLLGINKHRKALGLDGCLRNQFKSLWPTAVYEDNKKNFASSIAHQELMRIKVLPEMQAPKNTELLEALIEKYNPGGNNAESQSWCTVL